MTLKAVNSRSSGLGLLSWLPGSLLALPSLSGHLIPPSSPHPACLNLPDEAPFSPPQEVSLASAILLVPEDLLSSHWENPNSKSPVYL